jgi:predicted dehydrogenase
VTRAIGVAVVGFGWMGEVHARAYTRLAHHYPDAPRPTLVTVADPEPGRAEAAVHRYGFRRSTVDWRELLSDDEIGAVSVTAPNFLHREIGVAVARSGRHLWIEKPVGLDATHAREVADAVHAAGVQCAVGFNYRNAPAVEAARELIAAGDLGTVTHARIRLFSDYAAHPRGALSWRFERARGGNGVLGDLASHGVDLARYLLGEVTAVVADTAVFIEQRPRPQGAGSHFALADGEPGPVENEDYVGCLLRFASGARGVLEASRVSVGEQCAYGVEVHGTKGMLAWDFRRLGELSVSVGDAYQNQSVSTVHARPGDGEFAAFQPGAGIAMGYDDLKVVEAQRFLRSVADQRRLSGPARVPAHEGRPVGATIDDAVAAAATLDAMTASVRAGGWVEVGK